MKDLIPTNIEGIVINLIDNKREIILPASMVGEQFSKWKKRKGGVFYRDLFLWIRKKDHGKYVSMESGEEKLIVRLIDDNELDSFNSKKLVHGKIKDKCYMILLDLSENGKLNEKNGYIDEENKDDDLISEISMNINQLNIPQEDDEAGSGKSISLFED